MNMTREVFTDICLKIRGNLKAVEDVFN